MTSDQRGLVSVGWRVRVIAETKKSGAMRVVGWWESGR